MTDAIRIERITTYTADAADVARFMRFEDREELWQLSHSVPEDAVAQSIEMSDEAYVAFAGPYPVAVFGVGTTALGNHGVPWFLATREADAHSKMYMKMARKFLAHLLERCGTLSNVALASNRRSLVFLSRMGFDIGQPYTTQTGAVARHFVMERKHV
jgi:hypothetical protein